MPRTTLFYFGRFNVLAIYEDKMAMLLQGFRTDTIHESHRQRWGFFNIAEEESRLGTFLTGYLAKFRPVEEEEVAQLDTHVIGTASIENKIIARSRFCLHVPSGLIAFHVVAGQITTSTFRKVFAKLFMAGLQDFFVSAEISMVEDRIEFFNCLGRFARIYRVRVLLHPSNPRSARMWHRLDWRIKRRNATTYMEEIRNETPGGSLSIAGDLDLQSKFNMASDGYGVAEVTGLIEDRHRTVRTSDNPVVARVPSFQITSGGLLEHLADRFSEVLARISGER